jgi:dephospho-CoA kinase
MDWLEQGAERSDFRMVVIPLLYETHSQNSFDLIICVGCRPEIQYKRLLDRGLDHENASIRIQAQGAIEPKILAANYVLWNEGSKDVLTEQVRRVLNEIKKRPVKAA